MGNMDLVPLVDEGPRNSGARVLASPAGHREFAHTGLHDGDEVALGGLRLRALATPDHTHEHLSFVLPKTAETMPTAPTVVMCGHGERAMGAAGLLEQTGHCDLAVLEGGPDDWAAATGVALEDGA